MDIKQLEAINANLLKRNAELEEENQSLKETVENLRNTIKNKQGITTGWELIKDEMRNSHTKLTNAAKKYKVSIEEIQKILELFFDDISLTSDSSALKDFRLCVTIT